MRILPNLMFRWGTIESNPMVFTNHKFCINQMCPLKKQCAPLHGGRGGKIIGPGITLLTHSNYLAIKYNFEGNLGKYRGSQLGTPSEIKTVLCGKNSHVGRPPPTPPVWEFFRRNTVFFLKMSQNKNFL